MPNENQYPEQDTENLSVKTSEHSPLEQSAGESFKSFIWETVKIVIISLIIIIPVRYFVVQPFYVKGASMEPNFYDHEYLIINEISYRFNQVARGEIVVFRHPSGENNFYIKRIIGLPNERVVIENSKVKIFNQENPNGFVLNESEYLSSDVKFYDQLEITLEDNEFFVMGDNRASSLDSRKFGAVLRSDIIGKTWLRGWPFDRFRVFETPTY